MIPLAEKHFRKLDEENVTEPVGPNEDCDYYPCHYEGQDCTWCFCPLYPCEDESLGEWVKTREGEVWGCADCTMVHDERVAAFLLKRLREIGDGSVLEAVRRIEEDDELRRKLVEEAKRVWRSGQ
ncbi:MAG: hypothetical protein GXO28_02580 [Methanopyri archaeon]|nr:hypothetical protein [Methanopyri archaeon]